MKFILPVPPGINALYKSGYNRRTGKIMWYKSEAAESWLSRTLWELKLIAKTQPKVTGEKVTITWYFADKRRRDIDSGLKLLLDACVKVSILKDDSDITELHVFKKTAKTSFCEVEIT